MGPGKELAFKDTSLDLAKSNVGNYAGNHWIVGMFPNSVTQDIRDNSYAFVSLDSDIYAPTIEGLRFFWPRMTPGGLIFVHDYSSALAGGDEGCRRVLRELSHNVAGVMLPDACGSFVLTKQG